MFFFHITDIGILQRWALSYEPDNVVQTKPVVVMQFNLTHFVFLYWVRILLIVLSWNFISVSWLQHTHGRQYFEF
jgi:hypothetical protein